MADFEIDDTVDITDVVCPTTFVKAKVALEELELTANEDGTYTLIVRKVEDED